MYLKVVYLVDYYSYINEIIALILIRASLVAQRLKHVPPMWETQVQSLG